MKQEVFRDNGIAGLGCREMLGELISIGYFIDTFFSGNEYNWTIVAHKQNNVSTNERQIVEAAIRATYNEYHSGWPTKNFDTKWLEIYLDDNFPLINKTEQQ